MRYLRRLIACAEVEALVDELRRAAGRLFGRLRAQFLPTWGENSSWRYRARMARLGFGMPAPIAGGDDDDDDKGDKGGKGKGDKGGSDDENDDDDDDKVEPDDDWQKKARKHERAAKKERKAREAAEARARELEEGQATDHEKALKAAREEGAKEARAEMTPSLRAAKRKAAIAQHAAGRFASIKQAIRLADIDDDDLFDEEGEVDDDVVKGALDTLLEDEPNLAAKAGGSSAGGDAGGGKGGDKGGDEGVEGMSVDDHLADIQGKS